MGAVAFTQDAQKGRSEYIGHKEHAQNDIVLIALEAEGVFQSGSLCISKVRLVETVEEVHDGQQWEDAQVEFPHQGLLLGRRHVNGEAIFFRRHKIARVMSFDGLDVGWIGVNLFLEVGHGKVYAQSYGERLVYICSSENQGRKSMSYIIDLDLRDRCRAVSDAVKTPSRLIVMAPTDVLALSHQLILPWLSARTGTSMYNRRSK